jgi:hypothetical protein
MVDPKSDPRLDTLIGIVKEREAVGYAYEGADASFELLAAARSARCRLLRGRQLPVAGRAPLQRARQGSSPCPKRS